MTTRNEAREMLAKTREDYEKLGLGYPSLYLVVQFLFDNLDARGRLDDEPWKGMRTEPTNSE